MPLASVDSRPLVTISNIDILYGHGMCHAAYATSAPPAAAAWPSNNLALYMPIYLDVAAIVVKLWMGTGATNGNVDIALYDENYNRLVAAGSTAMSVANSIQTFDVTDTPVGPGRYYIGMVCSTTSTATFLRAAPALSVLRAWGMLQQATALPLPDPMVPVAYNSAYIPLCGLSMRVTL
jgi:hypothetical protein